MGRRRRGRARTCGVLSLCCSYTRVTGQPVLMPGELVFARAPGNPWWPALVLSESDAAARGIQSRGRLGEVPVIFFGAETDPRTGLKVLEWGRFAPGNVTRWDVPEEPVANNAARDRVGFPHPRSRAPRMQHQQALDGTGPNGFLSVLLPPSWLSQVRPGHVPGAPSRQQGERGRQGRLLQATQQPPQGHQRIHVLLQGGGAARGALLAGSPDAPSERAHG